MKPIRSSLAAACLSAVGAFVPAHAYEAGQFVARGGLHYVDPKSDNGDVVNVKSAVSVTGSVDYFLTPTVAVDLLVAVPFKHDIELASDGSKVASTQHLPPTLSLVWYPELSSTVKPFIGAGLNYTLFFNEKTRGALDGTHLSLDDSAGVAFVAGCDFLLDAHWGVSADLRWFDIDTKARLDGTSLGTVPIDPFGYGVSVSYRF